MLGGTFKKRKPVRFVHTKTDYGFVKEARKYNVVKSVKGMSKRR